MKQDTHSVYDDRSNHIELFVMEHAANKKNKKYIHENKSQDSSRGESEHRGRFE